MHCRFLGPFHDGEARLYQWTEEKKIARKKQTWADMMEAGDVRMSGDPT